MKVIACEKCGAKYQIDNYEDVNNYECSVCAGNLIEVEEHFSSSYTNQNNSNNLYQSLNEVNWQIVYCENCGLKYNLNKNEYPEDYECSSCFGNLRYIDEELNKDLEKRLNLRKETNTNFNSNSNLESDENSDLTHKSGTSLISSENEFNVNQIEKKLRKQINNEFSNNIYKEYQNIDNSSLKNDQPLANKNFDDIEKRIGKKIEKNNTSIIERIVNRIKKEKNEELSEDIIIEKEIAELNNPSKTAGGMTDDLINKDNKKHELVPHPNIKNTSYHDVYIVAGLILILIGFSDILLSQRIYSVIFIAIGLILFGIGIIQNKKYNATEKRGKIIREKLLTLPENFYVLYFVKVPNANDGINHVVVGASGIFAIVSQNFNEKEDKEKLKADTKNLNSVTKPKLDNLDLLGISDIVEQASNNYENNNKKNNDKNNDKNKNNRNISENIEEDNSIKDKKSRIEKFKFRETPIKFKHNNRIKQKSIQLSEKLIDFLNENGLSNCYVEPLVGFVNKDVAVINMPLTDEDLFLDELLYKIIHGKRQLDDKTTHKVAVLLSQYSTECSS